MKQLNEERLRKFPGLENLTDEEAQRIIAALHTLAVILIQSLTNDGKRCYDFESGFIEPKDSDNQQVKLKRR
jgi:hypothetical protein